MAGSLNTMFACSAVYVHNCLMRKKEPVRLFVTLTAELAQNQHVKKSTRRANSTLNSFLRDCRMGNRLRRVLRPTREVESQLIKKL